MITERNFYIAALVALVLVLVGESVATVSATGDVRCLFVKCVIIKK